LGPELPGEVQRIVERALAKDREARYETMRDFATDLEAIRQGTAHSGVKWRPFVFGALSVALVAGAAAIAVSRRPQLLLSTEARPAVAVIGFRNLSGRADAEWISGALSEELTTELAAGEKLRIISGEDVLMMKRDLAVVDAESYGSATLTRIRQRVGADIVVVGSYLELAQDASGRIRLDLRLQDTRSGQTVASFSTSGTDTALLDLVSTTGARLREALGVAALGTEGLASLGAALPASIEATQFYTKGLTKLRLFDALAARDLLREAIAAESTFAPAHAALADAWAMLGYSQLAREEAKAAFELSSRLPREQRLLMEARYYAAIHEWDKAIDLYRTLFNFFPDNPDYGLPRMRSVEARRR
jgi:TolB-like protein